ncbi:MAG: ubiquitin-conjugating enzyme/RWD-like protein [Piptocephalis tieghemiana]|nr:MAG: ubiquitin-conjugating enzyme/RWD-like protein [Piptocephalis tieghemiana]
MSSMTRRVLKELRDLQKQNLHAKEEEDMSHGVLALAPVSEDNLQEWEATISGPTGTPYEGRTFHFSLRIPETYPLHPPKVWALHPICHPNIHIKTGEVCLDILKTDWSPAWTLQAVCKALGLLLAHPEPDSPLNVDAANLLRSGDTLAYYSLVHHFIGPRLR